MQDYFSLAEVAKIIDGWSIADVKRRLFDGAIIPSRNLIDVQADLTVEVNSPPDEDGDIFPKIVYLERNVRFRGYVDIYGLQDCKPCEQIELNADCLESVLSGGDRFVLFHSYSSGQRVRVRLRESYRLQVNDLLVGREVMVRYDSESLLRHIGTRDETHTEFFNRRKADGVKPEKIAHELYDRGASDYHIGCALSIGKPEVEDASITKRGLRFRKDHGLQSKQ